MSRRPGARVLATTACAVVASVALAGCTGDDPDQELVACEDGGPAEYEACYDYSSRVLHCTLESLREQYARGAFELGDLPRWASTEERDGVPVIYDFQTTDPPFVTPAETQGQLYDWAEQQGVPVDEDADFACGESVTEAEVRDAEGG